MKDRQRVPTKDPPKGLPPYHPLQLQLQLLLQNYNSKRRLRLRARPAHDSTPERCPGTT